MKEVIVKLQSDMNLQSLKLMNFNIIPADLVCVSLVLWKYMQDRLESKRFSLKF